MKGADIQLQIDIPTAALLNAGANMSSAIDSLHAALARMPLGVMAAAAMSVFPHVQAAAKTQEQRICDAQRAEWDRLNALWIAEHPSCTASISLALRFRPDTMMRRKIRRMLRDLPNTQSSS